MKPPGIPKRRKPLPSRSGPPKRANPKRQAKRRKTYAQKLAAYRRSETYKLVEARAGGQCERITRIVDRTMYDSCGYPHPETVNVRCPMTRAMGERMTHNHLSYARFGGQELPEDIELLCDRHNAEYESQFPNRRNNHRKAS